MRQRSGPVRDFPGGFSLLEVLIAIVILSVALLGMSGLAGSIFGYNQLAQQVTTATTLAQDRIETLKNTPYSDIPEGTATESKIDAVGSSGGIYSRITEVTEDGAYGNTKTVQVTVTWALKGRPHSIVLKTLIAR